MRGQLSTAWWRRDWTGIFSIEIFLDQQTAIRTGSNKKEAEERASTALLVMMGYQVPEEDLSDLPSPLQTISGLRPLSPGESTNHLSLQEDQSLEDSSEGNQSSQDTSEDNQSPKDTSKDNQSPHDTYY